ncbi:hypothetical protein BV25DRAFT_1920367 [Artomyces pyxidatus]|uniref:Uncharacterized protein n=1 Tax=Artomyces pyxidatus TaxID=48021 RepID=A0ACB8SMZ7_9AGAM|nr:hypothetical protein BV25DRAFT_1920367 [Artomyces pyxidatus]
MTSSPQSEKNEMLALETSASQKTDEGGGAAALQSVPRGAAAQHVEGSLGQSDSHEMARMAEECNATTMLTSTMQNETTNTATTATMMTTSHKNVKLTGS